MSWNLCGSSLLRSSVDKIGVMFWVLLVLLVLEWTRQLRSALDNLDSTVHLDNF